MTLHYMLDVETTGARPDRAAILQIAAVKFDPLARTIDTADMFNRCLAMPGWRSWDEDTRRWWQSQNRAVFERILFNAEAPRLVLADFVTWVVSDGRTVDDRWFWAKNAAFDFMFIAGYLADYDLSNPFSYRQVNDMKCFARGRHFPNDVPAIEEVQTDQAHNALVDCITQIDWVFKALV